jgi:uncharacterized protein (DUF1330 family)
MTTYLILAKVINPEIFAAYIKGHIPTLVKFGGRVVFRSIDNVSGSWRRDLGCDCTAGVAGC